MDVDLFRPGTVPLAPDTVLWFEFLLDPDLLYKHLCKENPDPNAVELIVKFQTAVLDSVKNQVKKTEVENAEGAESQAELKPVDSLKNFALKILTLKVAAFMKWDLNIIESKLPFKLQIHLMQDLLFFTNGRNKVEIPNVPQCNIEEVPDHYLYSLCLYHRWMIRIALYRTLNAKSPKQLLLSNLEGQLPADECFSCSSDVLGQSVDFLRLVLASGRTPRAHTFATFSPPTEDSKSLEQDWSQSAEVPAGEFEAQVCYDLGAFYFHRQEYEAAKESFERCAARLGHKSENSVGVDKNHLLGYLAACGAPAPAPGPDLFQRMVASVADQYVGLVEILQEDNLRRRIPMSYRTVLELDIQGALSSGKLAGDKDLLLQVRLLNAIRLVADGGVKWSGDLVHVLRHGSGRAVGLFLAAAASYLAECSSRERRAVQAFLAELVLSEDVPGLAEAALDAGGLFADDDVAQIRARCTCSKPKVLPNVLLYSNWMLGDYQVYCPRLEVRQVEIRLITCYHPEEVRTLITELEMITACKPMFFVHPEWELPIPLQTVVLGLPRGFLQDFSYVLLAKSKELLVIKDFEMSKRLLNVLKTELNNLNSTEKSNFTFKLDKMIGWEYLLVEIAELLECWPGNQIDKKGLSAKCKACLGSLQAGDSVLPRVEIIEQCALCLLNLADWEYIIGVEKKRNYFEMAAAITYACQDLLKYGGNKKVSRDMWDLVLPIFGSHSGQTKRTASGSTSVMHRDSPSISTKVNLMSFLAKLRDKTALSVIISMLARLYNVLKDEMTLELNVEHIVLWPAVISNATSYNTKAVCEVLMQVVEQALIYYPTNISWLKLMGDIYFVNNYHDTALKYYLQALIVATDHFYQPNYKGYVDDLIIKRMIKCCIQLNCQTQAAVLCQFLEDIDYTLAFKCLQDTKPSFCTDAMDGYYNCFWDITILEFLVNLYHKRGESLRKQQVIKVIGTLELNSNNNSEIQLEAMNVRKSRVLKALVQQYLMSENLTTPPASIVFR